MKDKKKEKFWGRLFCEWNLGKDRCEGKEVKETRMPTGRESVSSIQSALYEKILKDRLIPQQN